MERIPVKEDISITSPIPVCGVPQPAISIHETDTAQEPVARSPSKQPAKKSGQGWNTSKIGAKEVQLVWVLGWTG